MEIFYKFYLILLVFFFFFQSSFNLTFLVKKKSFFFSCIHNFNVFTLNLIFEVCVTFIFSVQTIFRFILFGSCLHPANLPIHSYSLNYLRSTFMSLIQSRFSLSFIGKYQSFIKYKIHFTIWPLLEFYSFCFRSGV